MATIAKWGPMTFEVGPGKIAPINSLSTSFTLKAETNNDTSGTPPTNTRGLELQPISISTQYVATAGVDPLALMEEWKELVGEKNTLYINGRKFGPKHLQLKSVSVSDAVLNVDGQFISLSLDLSFEEYEPPNTAVSAKASNSSSVTAGVASGDTGSKAGAMNAKPSTEDKAQLKTSITGRVAGAALLKGVSTLLGAAGIGGGNNG